MFVDESQRSLARLKPYLRGFGVMEIQPVKSIVFEAALSGTEIALVAICCFIFFGAIIVIVVICISWRQYVETKN